MLLMRLNRNLTVGQREARTSGDYVLFDQPYFGNYLRRSVYCQGINSVHALTNMKRITLTDMLSEGYRM